MRLLIKICLLAIFSINIANANNDIGDSKNLTIFSESNLSVQLVKIARLYAKEKNVVVSIDFNSSSSLIEKIDDGEPADIFISSHKKWMNILKQKGVIDIYSLSDVASDSLLLVSSKDNKQFNIAELKQKNIKEIFEIINKTGTQIILDSKFNSLGIYGNQVVEQYKIKPNIIFRKVKEDTKSMIEFLQESDSLFGIVSKSSILPEDNIDIVATIPDIKINYQASVIAGNNMSIARDFIKFLESKEVKKIF